jgi:ATP-binding cassette subfamily B protein
LVFDEATSALDHETEQAVMEAIEGLSAELTILIIAHRTATLRSCDQIIDLGSGPAGKKVTAAAKFKIL